MTRGNRARIHAVGAIGSFESKREPLGRAGARSAWYSRDIAIPPMEILDGCEFALYSAARSSSPQRHLHRQTSTTMISAPLTPGPPVPSASAHGAADDPPPEPEFNEIATRVNKLLHSFQTRQPVLTLTCSGTGGVEATMVSLFSPGDTIIAVNGGKFGERWVKIPKAYGMKPVEIKVQWGKAPSQDDILAALKSHPEAKAVYLTHSETSTGAATDMKSCTDHQGELGGPRLCRRHHRDRSARAPVRRMGDRCLRDRISEGTHDSSGPCICRLEQESNRVHGELDHSTVLFRPEKSPYCI